MSLYVEPSVTTYRDNDKYQTITPMSVLNIDDQEYIQRGTIESTSTSQTIYFTAIKGGTAVTMFLLQNVGLYSVSVTYTSSYSSASIKLSVPSGGIVAFDDLVEASGVTIESAAASECQYYVF